MARADAASLRERGFRLLERGEWESDQTSRVAKYRYKKAMACFDRALRLEPADSAALRGKAAALYGIGRHRKALAYIDEALRLEPKNAPALYEKARIVA